MFLLFLMQARVAHGGCGRGCASDVIEFLPFVHVFGDSLAELVGDGYEWLNWYCFDNDMGKKAYEAGWEGDMRPITQAADLLWLIEGGGGDKEATWAEA